MTRDEIKQFSILVSGIKDSSALWFNIINRMNKKSRDELFQYINNQLLPCRSTEELAHTIWMMPYHRRIYAAQEITDRILKEHLQGNQK